MSTFKVNIPAGPLWSDEDAKEKAPKIAAAHQGKWTGQWNTVVPSEMSVIEVELNVKNSGNNEFTTDVLAGPIWSNDEAQQVGSAIAASYGAEFTGQWNTIVEGVMSVIQIKYTF
ncbi:MAG: lectin MVL [Crocinitomicaceae bacterium]|nr:lectin MVL [Crocinitomicaceae bacterium]|tara:strand:+ start:746 stop:1090 length:345 start_codon:yes stop_codon:yes gene_type:complete